MPDVGDVLAVGIAADRGDVLALMRVVQVGEARVVELEVAAAELAEAPYLFPISSGQVGPEGVEIRIDRLVDRGAAAAVVDHARRGDRQLRRGTVDRVAQEGEVVAEDRLAEADPAVDVHRGRGELDRAFLVAELDLQLARRLADAVERVDEVHVPRGAAELAVGRRLEPGLALKAHHVSDRVVLDRP